MAELIPDDIYEKIFLPMDFRDLIRCKSVCKTWRSFLCGSRFVKAHLNRSYNKNDNRHKRIGEAVFRMNYFYNRFKEGYTLIGYSNGLICIDDGYDHYNDYKLLVGNPSTREGRIVPKSPLTSNRFTLCWGFGHDPLTDDYKVVQGVKIGKDKTFFQVFSLKSNAWHANGEVYYIGSEAQSGVLCNGAIHWVMHSIYPIKNKVILSFDLSTEEIKIIPKPDFTGYKLCMYLGIMENCLCIRRHKSFELRSQTKEWVMKKHNGRQSWELLPDNCRIKFEFGKKICKELGTHATLYVRYWFIGNRRFKGGPTIVESLVSPHLQADNE